MVKPTPDTVPSQVSPPSVVVLGVNVHGRPVMLGRAHRPLPLTVTVLILALAPPALMVPLKTTLQFTVAPKDEGPETPMVPVAVNGEPPVMVAAEAMPEIPRPIARAPAQG